MFRNCHIKGVVIKTMVHTGGKEFLFVLFIVLNMCVGSLINRGPIREDSLNDDQKVPGPNPTTEYCCANGTKHCPLSVIQQVELCNTVWKWSQTLSRRLVAFSENVTAIDSITTLYTKYTYVDEVKGDDLIDDLASKIEKLLKDRVTALDNLVEAAERLYEDYTFDPNLDIDYINSKKLLSEADLRSVSPNVVNMEMTFRSLKLSPDPDFNNMPVTKNISSIQVPTNVFDRSPKIMNGAHWTKPLDDTFISNFNNYSLTWQYYCSTDGFFRIYPVNPFKVVYCRVAADGMKWPSDNVGNNIDLFDCRVRSWYLQAATCPKNVVILLDTSGSMKGLRMEIARSTVKQIINTLDDDDYFNIIRFSDTFEYLDECFNGSMMTANSINKLHMSSLVDDTVEAKNKANFEIAFEEAFRLLSEELTRRNAVTQQGYLCNKAILLVTDGVPEHHAPLFEKYNWPEKLVRIFTYLIGREIGDEREVKWMACANKGYYTHISTLADVQENVQNYIRVLSRPMVIKRFHNKIWTSIYLDHMSSLNINKGLKFLTSVAIPVFDKKNETVNDGNLLGVVGTDIPIKYLQSQTPAYKLGANAYAFMINHNGYVLFHPDYRPYFTDPNTNEVIINPHYQNVDLSDVILPTNQKAFNEVREHILSGNLGSKMLEVLTHYDDMRRMVWRNYSFSYKKVMDTNFSLGIALPTTSFVEVTMVRILADEENINEWLNESSTLLAPWRYCVTLDDELTGKQRVGQLKELLKQILENETLWKLCEKDLINMVLTDSKYTHNLSKEWSQVDSKAKRDGLEMVFVGTPSGVTKYHLHNPESEALFYLLNRTSTVEADYYRRAIEGAELLDNQPHWNYTFSTPIGEEYDDNKTMVTVSAPVVQTRDKKMGVAAVVGYQMKLSGFHNIFMESIEECRMISQICKNTPCKEKPVHCYLIDNHGYIISGPYPHVAGLFFGDLEGSVMTDMIQTKRIFVGYNFTDYQSVCEIKADSGKDMNGGSAILNPFKFIFNLLMWILADIAIFISELSLTSLWTPTAVGDLDCNNITDYEDVDMSAKERMSYQQAALVCFKEKEENKVVGHRPCVKQFTLYHSDLNVFKTPVIHGTLDGCMTCLEFCSPEDAELGKCVPNFCMKESSCLKSYVVSWVQGTNLLMVVTAANCECNTTMPFNMDHVEVAYSEEEMCSMRSEETYKERSFACPDHSKQENELECGGETMTVSSVLFLLTLMFSSIFSHLIIS